MTTHLTAGQELTQMGQQKKQQKMAEVEISSNSPRTDPSGSLRLQSSSQQVTELQPVPLLVAAQTQTQNQKERLPANTMSLSDCWSILQSLQSPGGEQIFNNIRQVLCLLSNKTSVTLQWIPLTVVLEAIRKQIGCKKWEANWSKLRPPCPSEKQRPSYETTLGQSGNNA